jgi:DoxX-like family
MGLTRGLTAFIGIAELAGAIGVVLPMAVNIAPWLSAWAAVELATVMLLAIGYHVCRREWPGAPATLFARWLCLWGLGGFLTGREEERRSAWGTAGMKSPRGPIGDKGRPRNEDEHLRLESVKDHLLAYTHLQA